MSSDRQSNFVFTQSGTNITAPVTWNTAKTVKGVITIKATGTLTIDGATIEFANTYTTNDWLTLSQGGGVPTKIVIEPQGKLILKNGATLKGLGTSICGGGTQESMWEGVVLTGQPTLSQGTAFQGYAEMTGNAKIQNAYVGIHVGSTYYNSDGRSTSTGNVFRQIPVNLFNDPDCPSPGVAESHIRSRVNFEYRARSGGSYNVNEIPTCVSNGPNGTNGIVTVQFCGVLNSNISACDPPCTNCSAAEAMMAGAANETEPWTQQNMFNQAINLYLKEGNAQTALQVAKDHF